MIRAQHVEATISLLYKIGQSYSKNDLRIINQRAYHAIVYWLAITILEIIYP